MGFTGRQRYKVTRWARAKFLAMLVGALFLPGCVVHVHTVKSQAFSKLDQLETELKRGVSTKADVITLLGEPDGSGGAQFPTASYDNDVWYYEASRASLSNMDQNILLVYFREEVFDGFMWFSNNADVDLR